MSAITLHGLDLAPGDALSLNATALQVVGERINECSTFHEYETASAFLATSALDAVTMLGASIADLVRWTELGPDVLLDIIGQGFQPFARGES